MRSLPLSAPHPTVTGHAGVARGVARSMLSYARALRGWSGGLRPEIMCPPREPRGVAVTVCGFGDSAATWSRLHRALIDDGLAVVPVVWNPLNSSLAELVERVGVAAHAATAQTGASQLHLVGHSIGGVIARRAVQHGALYGRADSVTTLSSPHRGAPLARLARRWVPLAAELDREGARVDPGDRDPSGATWTAVVVTDDLIVPPARQALFEIPGAENVHVSGTDHLGVLRHDRAIATVLAATAPTAGRTPSTPETLAA